MIINKLQFEEGNQFTPNMLLVPAQWDKNSFDTVDFTGKEKLKDFLELYLSRFDYDGADSLILRSTDFAYQLFVALYKEIGSRISADSYRFYNWSEYVAGLSAKGYKAESDMLEDLFDTSFVFMFDVTFSQKQSFDYFSKIVQYVYINGIRMFICTRVNTADVIEQFDKETQRLLKSKFVEIEIK
jgi:hypothetical protein